MNLFKQLALKDSIEIKTTPEKIWEFFTNLEQNYKTWHPEDHVLFKWTKGRPWEEASTFYAEQYVMGKITKYKGTIVESVPYRKIVSKFSFPISVVSPKIEWLIETKGSNSVFTAITYLRAGSLLSKISKKGMKTLIEAHDKHVREEGENLKKILEGEGEEG